MAQNEWAAWVQAIGSVLAIFVAIWIGKDSSTRARRLVEDERRRQAAIGTDVIAQRLRAVAKEARRKILWLEQDGAPEVFGRKVSWDQYRVEAERFRLASGNALAEEARAAIFFLTGIAAARVVTSIDVIADYNASVDAEIATLVVRDEALGSFHRQKLESQLIHELRTVIANADSTAAFLEKDWRLPGSPAPDAH